MIGLDTNVLVRYLVRDDKQQAELAAGYIRKTTANGTSCFINTIVLCELVWVLESAYNYDKTEIVGMLNRLLITKQLEIEARDIVRQAIHDYRTGRGDLADYLIGRINLAKGCERSATFDRALRGTSAYELLE